MTALTRHPLHLSVLESFADLRERPDTETANFVATISKILSDAFIALDPEHHMPAFMTDRGVSILRFAADEPETDVIPGADRPVRELVGDYHDAMAATPGSTGRAVAGSVALSAPRETLRDLLADETLRAGGTLAFFDPIYEDSFVLVRMTAAAQGEWALRTSDGLAA